MEDKVSDEFFDCLSSICNDKEMGTLKANYGPRHEFLGMPLDCSEPRKLIVDVSESFSEMVEEFEMECELPMSKTQIQPSKFLDKKTSLSPLEMIKCQM